METGNLLTSIHSHTYICNNKTYTCANGWRDQHASTNTLLDSCSCLSTVAHVCIQNTHTHTGRPVQQAIFCIIHEGENIQIIMSFCFSQTQFLWFIEREREILTTNTLHPSLLYVTHQFDQIKFCLNYFK